jgi:eukaryotic-like serine/threonine-protein kinase
MEPRETLPLADPRAIEEQLARIIASPHFASSGRLSAFLAFIVRKTLAGEGSEIKEYTVGTQVFDRAVSFDPRVDTIVRVQASKLRTRLNEYYATAGVNDPIIIELPRGSYLPGFHANNAGANKDPEELAANRVMTARRWTLGGRHAKIIVTLAGSCLIVAGIAYRLGTNISTAPQTAIRFTLLPPDNTAFRYGPQISPDGTRVVSAVVDPLGRRSIWVRSLSDVSGQFVPGTEGGSVAFWSEDGHTILFLDTDNRYYKVDMLKPGPPQFLAPATLGFGAALSKTGLLLAARDGLGIGRMAQTGAPFSGVTELDASHQEVGHSFPEFLPNGTGFLYFAHNRNPAENAVYAATLDGRQRKRLLASESQARYAPANPNTSSRGYLLYVRERTLFAHAFDPKTWQLSGSPYRVVQDGIHEHSYGMALFSASATGVLVYRSELGLGGQFVWFDRAGKQLGTVGPPGMCSNPAISPDGKQLAFDFSDGPNRDVWTADLSTGHQRRLTFDPEVDHGSVWSPEGGRVAFESHRGGPGKLSVKDLKGAGPEALLLQWPNSIELEDWSRDDRFLAFSTVSADKKGEIWIFPFKHGSGKPFLYLQTKGIGAQARFSPNSRWIAYVSDESGRREVYVQAFNGSSAANGGKWLISSDGGVQPAWRADGRELFYLAPNQKLMAVDVNVEGTFTSGRPRALFEVDSLSREGPRSYYHVTPDGKRFLIKTVWRRNPPSPIHVFVNWAAALRE